MNEIAYRDSAFWTFAGMFADLASVLGPVLALITATIWFLRERQLPALVSVTGGIFLCGGVLVRALDPQKGNFVYLGWLHPMKTDNAVTTFVHLYGTTFGLFLFSIGVAIYFWRQRRAA